MPSGACVIRRELQSGDVSWRIKFVDANEKQVMRVVGRESTGVTK